MSNVIICGLIVSMCISKQKFVYHDKKGKKKFIEYKEVFCAKKFFKGRMMTFDTAKESLDPTLSLK